VDQNQSKCGNSIIPLKRINENWKFFCRSKRINKDFRKEIDYNYGSKKTNINKKVRKLCY
jgi:hypothetical protein